MQSLRNVVSAKSLPCRHQIRMPLPPHRLQGGLWGLPSRVTQLSSRGRRGQMASRFIPRAGGPVLLVKTVPPEERYICPSSGTEGTAPRAFPFFTRQGAPRRQRPKALVLARWEWLPRGEPVPLSLSQHGQPGRAFSFGCSSTPCYQAGQLESGQGPAGFGFPLLLRSQCTALTS